MVTTAGDAPSLLLVQIRVQTLRQLVLAALAFFLNVGIITLSPYCPLGLAAITAPGLLFFSLFFDHSTSFSGDVTATSSF